MNAIRNWFTPATRESIYAAIAALAPIFVAAGFLVPTAVEPILIIVGAGLQALSGILALANLKPTEAARWFGTVGRGVLYGGTATVAAAVVTLGFVTQDWATGFLTFVSLGLTAGQAILAIVTPKEVPFNPADIPVIAKAIITPDNAVVAPVVDSVVEGITPPVVVDPLAEPADPIAEPEEPVDSNVDEQGQGFDNI